jgi:putative MATE family efflux protein
MADPRSQRFDRRITDGPLLPAVWHLAWPTILQNMIGGLQGMLDHTMVGHAVGFRGNAAIGISWQIFLVVIVFISSVYTGVSVLVARFAGAGDTDKVNRVVYQAFLVSVVLGIFVMAPVGYFATPFLLQLVHAAPDVQTEALPYLRIMFSFGIGLLLFFMLGGALRAAGDAKTPLRLGMLLTGLHVALNIVFIRGLGPIPAMGVKGAALGDVISSVIVGVVGVSLLFTHRTPIWFSRGMSLRPDWPIIRSLFKFGLPSGLQGVAMNIGGVLLLRYIGSLADSAAAQAAYTVAYTQLFSFITWSSVGLMGATAAVAGQNLGARQPDRAKRAVSVTTGMGLLIAGGVGTLFVLIPRTLLGLFDMTDPRVLDLGVHLLRVLAVSGLFVTVALVHTGALQGTGDTRSPFYISIVSQIGVPLGICALLEQTRGGLQPEEIWLAILAGHVTRCVLSVLRFRQGKWASIAVDIEGGAPAAPARQGAGAAQ